MTFPCPTYISNDKPKTQYVQYKVFNSTNLVSSACQDKIISIVSFKVYNIHWSRKCLHLRWAKNIPSFKSKQIVFGDTCIIRNFKQIYLVNCKSWVSLVSQVFADKIKGESCLLNIIVAEGSL